MSLSDWLSLVVICIMGATFPGASLAVVLRHTLNNSRLHGITTAIAHGLGVGFYAVLSVLGLVLVLQQSPTLLTVITYGGAAYLFWLGWQGLMAKPTEKTADMDAQTSTSLLAAARDGLLVALLNPKIGLYFLALFSQFVQASMSLIAKSVFVGTITIIDGGWYVLVAAFLSQGKTLIWMRKNQLWMERFLGLVLILLALHVVLGLKP